jgi:hypothetical protein
MDRLLLPNLGLVALGLAAPLAACSSMPDSIMASAPAAMAIRLESEPPGAEARTSLGQSCRTPCSLAVAASDDLAVTFSLKGYQSQTLPVRARPALEGIEHEVGPDLMRAHTQRHNAGPAPAPDSVYAELQKATPSRRHASRETRSRAVNSESVSPIVNQ